MFVITEHPIKLFEDFLSANGIDRYRARQIFHWVYKKARFEFSAFGNLPKSIRDFLEERCRVLAGEIIQQTISKQDKTIKFLIRLPDGHLIESALLYSDDGRLTACLSTQVGCSILCIFCASGKSGFRRSLSTGEIVSQYLLMRQQALRRKKDVTNIVFMGVGEPLLNYDNLTGAIDLLTDPIAVNMASRRIVVSTAGIAPAIDKLAAYKKQIKLSISLHSPFNRKRSQLVPINKRYNLNTLLSAVKRYLSKTGRAVTFEYVLIKGINDTEKDAVELGRILKYLHCKVNLIPYNPVNGVGFKTPAQDAISGFAATLLKNRVKVIVRQRKGADINSGCGQLKASFFLSGAQHEPRTF